MSTKRQLTILLYQQLYNAINNSDSEIAIMYNILSTLENKPVEYYKNLKWSEFNKQYKEANIPTMDLPDTWVSSFEVEGETFYVTQYATDWNVEQFITMSTLTKDKDMIINNLHLILTTLCYKIKGEKIDKTEFNRRSELLLNYCEAKIAYPIGFFFALLLVKLSQTSQYSSHLKKQNKYLTALKKAKEQSMMKKAGFTKSGTGMQQLKKFLLKVITLKWNTILK